MMDGYSVQDAASVLGVPEGRVWELLARGVLTGTPEGDSMRVFLKTEAPAASPPAPREELPRSNGNGGSHGAEASAFRELLTEFRNLTERYGQALLALGEARGEVAGLRSRVDLLEARLELRLPAAIGAAPVAWEPPATAPEPPAPASAEATTRVRTPMPRPPRPRKATPRPRKAASTRAAVAGFADALARAQDPNPAEVGEVAAIEVGTEPLEGEALAEVASFVEAPEASEAPEAPEASEAAETPEAPEGEAPLASEAAEGEAPLVSEAAEVEALAPDEPTAPDEVAAPAEPTYSAVVVEPDWFADGDFSWLDAADLEARTQPPRIEDAPLAAAVELEVEAEAPAEPEPFVEAQREPKVEVASQLEPEPEPMVEVASQLEPEPEPEPMVEVAALPEPEPVVASLPEPEPVVASLPEPEPVVEVASLIEPVAEPEVTVEAETTPEPAVAADPEIAAPVSPEPAPESSVAFEVPRTVEVLGADEEPLMWLGGPRDAADEIEITATAPAPQPRPAPRRDPSDPIAWPATDRTATVTQTVAPPLAMTEEELAQLARDEGWDDAEVAAIRAMISRPAPRTVQLPGAAELDEAMSALQAVPIGSRPDDASSRQWAKSATPDEETSPYADWAFEVEPARPQTPARQPAPGHAGAADPVWLRRRRGPAATAYRRIRRLFNG